MKHKLLMRIASDMNIRRFQDELDCDFNQRIIYSAGSAWAKTLVYGRSYADIKNKYDFANADIMYIQSHLARVIEGYLEIFDVNLNWLKEEKSIGLQSSSLAGQIIEDVIYTFNLAKTNSRRIVPIQPELYKYDDKFLVRGEWPRGKTVYSVGTAQWICTDELVEYKEDKRIIDVAGKHYYNLIEGQAEWQEEPLNASYLIFVEGEKRGYLKSWKPIDISAIPCKVVMLKLADEYNGGYFLARNGIDGVEVLKLDPWYIDEKEIYRILYAMNYHNGTPTEFHVEKHTDFYELRFSNPLPTYEDRIIKSCSWPYGTFDSKYVRIVPSFLWRIAEQALTFLGINIKVSLNAERCGFHE